jgi:hypothetical protein
MREASEHDDQWWPHLVDLEDPPISRSDGGAQPDETSRPEPERGLCVVGGFCLSRACLVAADAEAAAEAVRQLAVPELVCLFLYQAQVDGAGHAHGFHPTVAEYVSAIEAVDRNLADVLAALESRPTRAAEDWLVVVTSDHGGRGTNHEKGHDVPEILHSFLIVSGDAAARGTFAEPTYLVDAPATVLAHLGIEPEQAWGLDGVPRGLNPAR